MNVLLVGVGNALCGLPLSDVREVMRPLALERNPSLPASVLGTCLIREQPTPVIDMSALIGGLGFSPQRFVSVSVGERQVALAVSAVLGTTRIDAQQFREATPLVRGSSEAIAALMVLDAKLVYVINSARLLPDELLPQPLLPKPALGGAPSIESSGQGSVE